MCRRTICSVRLTRPGSGQIVSEELNRLNGTPEALDIVLLMGVCLCLIGYADCLVKTGALRRQLFISEATSWMPLAICEPKIDE